MPRAIDCFVNVSMGEGAPPEFLQRVAADYWPRALPLREGVLDLFLYENTNRLFFSKRQPTRSEA